MLLPEVISGNGYKILCDVVVALILVGVGTHVNLADLTQMLKSRSFIAILAALVTLLLGLAPIAVLICRAFDLTTSTALTLLLIASCPGGPASSVLSGMSGGILLVNGTMTLCSSVCALATVPLSMLLYKPLVTDHETKIDWLQLVLTTLLIFISLSIGAACNHFIPTCKPWLQQLSGAAALPIVVGVVVLGGIPDITAADFAATCMLSIAAAASGFIVAIAARANRSVIKSLIFELLCRDVGMAVAIVTSAFTDKQTQDMGRFAAMLYGLVSLVVGIVLVVLFRAFDCLKDQNDQTLLAQSKHEPLHHDPSEQMLPGGPHKS